MKTQFSKLFKPLSTGAKVLFIGMAFLFTGAASLASVPEVAKASPNQDVLKLGHDFEQTWARLSDRWLAQLEGPGWVYSAYKMESPGDHGIDLNVNWPLPNRRLNEHWYLVDEGGRILAVLGRGTDLERGNVWLGSWQDNRLVLHYPGKQVDMGPDVYTTLEDALRLRCHKPEQPNATLTSEFIQDGERSLFVSTSVMIYDNPSSTAGPIPGVYSGQEITCIRESPTGAMVSLEKILIGEDHQRVLLTRLYDFNQQRVAEPPAEMLALLDQR